MQLSSKNRSRKNQTAPGPKLPPGGRRQKAKPRFHGGTFVGALVLLFVITYMATAAYAFLNRQTIPTVEIQIDVIDTQKGITDGVIIRREEVIYSNGAGFLEFAAADKERVKKGAPLLYISDLGETEYYRNSINELGGSIYDLYAARGADADEISAHITETAEKSAYRLIGTDMSELYALAEAVSNGVADRNRAALDSGRGALGEYAGELRFFESELSKHVKSIYAGHSGILSYYTDGMEDVFSFNAIESLTYDQTQQKPERIVSYAKRDVEANIPVAKIVTGNDWYIAAHIETEHAQGLKIGDIKRLYIDRGGDAAVPVDMSVYYRSAGAGAPYVYAVFKSTKNIVDYMDIRNVTFKLTDSAHSGYKVPNSAVVTRAFVKTPEHIVQNDTVIRQTDSGTRRASVTSNKTNAPPGYVYMLLDFSVFAIGDTLLPHGDTGGAYTISESDFLMHTGVYRVIGPTAKFVCIDDEDAVSAGGYTILDPSKNPALRPHDRIVVDGANISENQIIDS